MLGHLLDCARMPCSASPASVISREGSFLQGGAASRARCCGAPAVLPAGCHFVPATHERIRYVGRTEFRYDDGAVRFDWSATRVVFSTRATRVRVRMDGGRNDFNVLVDGRRAGVLRTRSGVRDYDLALVPASGPEPRAVELVKRTEVRIGTASKTILGLTTTPVVLLGLLEESPQVRDEAPAPPAPAPRRIEFVGDSETAGFGNLGPSEPGSPGFWSFLTMDPADEDATEAWPAVVSGALGAEFTTVAWSGMGVRWNAPGHGCTTRRTMLEAYGALLGAEVDAPRQADPEDWARWVPDIVVVYIGGNDWYTLAASGDREAALDELSGACAGLVRAIRAVRPASAVLVLLASRESFCACIATLEEQACFADDMTRCWRQAVEAVGDPRIRLETVRPDPMIDVADPSDWGQMAHWSAQGHGKWARAAAPLIARHAGWA